MTPPDAASPTEFFAVGLSLCVYPTPTGYAGSPTLAQLRDAVAPYVTACSAIDGPVDVLATLVAR